MKNSSIWILVVIFDLSGLFLFVWLPAIWSGGGSAVHDVYNQNLFGFNSVVSSVDEAFFVL